MNTDGKLACQVLIESLTKIDFVLRPVGGKGIGEGKDAVNLYAVIYIKGHLAAAMFLWSGASAKDCAAINAEYGKHLDTIWSAKHLDHDPVMVDPSNPRVRLVRSDFKLTCEWHQKNPVTP